MVKVNFYSDRECYTFLIFGVLPAVWEPANFSQGRNGYCGLMCRNHKFQRVATTVTFWPNCPDASHMKMYLIMLTHRMCATAKHHHQLDKNGQLCLKPLFSILQRQDKYLFYYYIPTVRALTYMAKA